MMFVTDMGVNIDDDDDDDGGGCCCRNGRTSTYSGSRQIMAVWTPFTWTVTRSGCQRYRSSPRELLKYILFRTETRKRRPIDNFIPHLPPTLPPAAHYLIEIVPSALKLSV
jgi:hypothetical protein